MYKHRDTRRMEKFRKHFKLKKSVKYWVWLGRLAPLTALVMLLIATTFEMSTFTSWVVLGICILFAITAFTWWWWVIYAVRDIFRLLNSANKRFAEVLVELKSIKKEYLKKKKR